MTGRQGLSKDQIVQIAKSKGYFDVTLRWRDDRLRGKCFGLKKEGKLTGGRRIGRVQRFYPVKETTHGTSEH